MRNEKQLLERYTNLLNALKSSENSGVNPWSVTALCGMSQTIPTVMLRMGYLSNTKIGKIEPIHARRLMEYVRDHASQARKIPKKPGIKMKQKFKPHPVQIAYRKKPFNYSKATFIGSLFAAGIATAALCLSLFK
jgi:hypothetical protein